MIATILFYLFAAAAIGAALMTITRRSPVASAIWLIGTFFSLAAIYTLLGAFFIGIIQILVYAGAIMVLFLFVIMLLNLGNDFQSDVRGTVWKMLAAGSGLVLLALIARMYFVEAVPMPLGTEADPELLATQLAANGAVGAIAIPLYTDFVVPLQVTAILLLIATIGAAVLAKRRI